MPDWPPQVNEEIRQHLEDRYDELRAAGRPHDEAMRAALQELDGADYDELTSVDHRTADSIVPGAQPTHVLADLAADVRFALRMVRRHPGFAAIVILTLAIGIGATAAIFSVVDAVLLRPLPFAHADRLVRLYHTYPYVPDGIEGLSPADFFASREQTRAFEAIATYRTPNDGLTFMEGDRPSLVYATFVTADFFKVLGARPLLGRTFEEADQNPKEPLKVVVSYEFWRQRLHGDPTLIGQTQRIAGLSVPIVGVMPPGFWFPRSDRAELWAIERMAPATRQGPWFYSGLGLLRPGVTAAQAQTDLDAAAGRVRRKFPLGSGGWTLVMRPLQRQLVGDLRPALLLLLCAVALVLVIAGVNVTNLILARATVRHREVAVRTALGASRGRIVRQLLAEGLALAACGAAGGLVLARAGVTLLLAMTPDNLQLLHDAKVGVDGRVLAVAALITIGCAPIFGLAPVAAGSTGDLAAAINESARGTEAPRHRRLRSALVVAEIAVSVVLLVGAGLVVRSLIRLQGVDPGVRTDRILTTTITIPAARAREQTQVDAFYDRLLAGVRALPGVEAAATTDGLPPGVMVGASNFIVDGKPMPNGAAEPIGELLNVDGDYFRTFGVPLLRGRVFDERDAPNTPNTLIVNETLARRFFPDSDPIGRKLRVSGNWVGTIVGVVANVRYSGLEQSDDLTMYAAAHAGSPRTMALVVRTASDPEALVPAIRAVVAGIDPTLPLGRTRTAEQLIGDSIVRPRFRTALLALFAGVALVLAAIGIYGVMLYSVSQRTREMGIRMALGARARDVRGLVLRDGLSLALAGIAIGTGGALALTRTMTGLLFAVTATDPLTFAAVAILLVAVALCACSLPAYRATRVDPVVALRTD